MAEQQPKVIYRARGVDADIQRLVKAYAAERDIKIGDALGELVRKGLGRSRQKVVIEVAGGVASVSKSPSGVAVEIVDHDNEEAN